MVSKYTYINIRLKIIKSEIIIMRIYLSVIIHKKMVFICINLLKYWEIKIKIICEILQKILNKKIWL